MGNVTNAEQLTLSGRNVADEDLCFASKNSKRAFFPIMHQNIFEARVLEQNM